MKSEVSSASGGQHRSAWRGARDFADAALRGSGQVIFMNSPRTGLLNVAALCWGAWAGGTSWAVVAGALAGLALATAAAQAAGLDRAARGAGLYGFNGLLVGAALPSLLATTPALWALLALAALASTALTWALARLLQPLALPGLTFPFIATTWLALWLAPYWPGGGIEALAPPLWTAPDWPFGLLAWVRATLVGVAQVFFVDDAGAGAIFLLALAAHSRSAAALAAAGAALGAALALAAGADPAAIAHGQWGYAAALTAPAVGAVFLVPGRARPGVAWLAAVATVAVQALAFRLAGALGMPTLTIAFVLASWAVLWLWRPRGPAAAATGA